MINLQRRITLWRDEIGMTHHVVTEDWCVQGRTVFRTGDIVESPVLGRLKASFCGVRIPVAWARAWLGIK